MKLRLLMMIAWFVSTTTGGQQHDNMVWKRHFDGSRDGKFQAVTTVHDGIVAAGSSAGKESYRSGLLVKYDYSGNVVWKHHLDIDSFPTPTNSAMYESTQKNFPTLPNRNAHFTELHFNGVTSLSDGIIAVCSIHAAITLATPF